MFVDPTTLPAGPFLGYDHDGKLVTTTYMIPLSMMKPDMDIKALKTPAGKVDHVEIAICDQFGKAAICLGYIVPPREIEHMLSPRGHRRHLDIHAVDALVGVDVQLRDEAAAGKANPYLFHRRCLR